MKIRVAALGLLAALAAVFCWRHRDELRRAWIESGINEQRRTSRCRQ